MFKRLKISDWRQFSNVDISFHPHLTVLTGANGAGKTTILTLIKFAAPECRSEPGQTLPRI